MSDEVIKDLNKDHLDEWFHSNLQEIQKDHGGKFIALLDSGETIVKEQYLELLKELKKRDIDSESVTITNVPTKKE